MSWNPLDYLGWANNPYAKADLIPIADMGGELGVPLVKLGDPEISPKNRVEENRMLLMRLMQRSVTGRDTDYGYLGAYHAFPVYVRDEGKSSLTLEEMEGYNLIREVTAPSETSEDIVYLKICRKLQGNHKILLGLFEKRVGGSSEWSLQVCDAPEDSRFRKEFYDKKMNRIERISVPIIFEDDLAPEVDCDISYKKLYVPSHGKIAGVTLRDMLTRLINDDEAPLDRDPREIYSLSKK